MRDNAPEENRKHPKRVLLIAFFAVLFALISAFLLWSSISPERRESYKNRRTLLRLTRETGLVFPKRLSIVTHREKTGWGGDGCWFFIVECEAPGESSCLSESMFTTVPNPPHPGIERVWKDFTDRGLIKEIINLASPSVGYQIINYKGNYPAVVILHERETSTYYVLIIRT